MQLPDSIHEQLAKLQEHGLRLRQNLDQAQATVGELNEHIQRIAGSGLVHDMFLLGEIFYQEPYENNDDADTGRAFQATLSVPGGFGAATWDTEAYYTTCRRGDPQEPDARLNNILFAALTPRVQAHIIPEIRPLMDRFLLAIGAKAWRPISNDRADA